MPAPIIPDLLDACERVYDRAEIVAGPDGIHGASVTHAADGSIILAFRGTLTNGNAASALDWLGDFHADLVRADGFPGRVHAGFLGALNALWPDVFEAIEGPPPKPAPLPSHPANPVPWWRRLLGASDEGNIFLPMPEAAIVTPWNRRITLCGHSKGAALAILAGVRLAALRPRVITFAGPMTGDVAFAANYPEEVQVTRYEGIEDLVPMLPGRLLGYRAVGDDVRSQSDMPLYVRELAVGKLIAEGKWERIHANHSLDTGYVPWIAGDEPTPPAVEQRRAA